MRRERPRRLRSIALTLAAVGAALGASAAPAAAPVHAWAATACPWMDASQTPDQRARQLLAAMTVDDKIAVVHQALFEYFGTAGWIPAIPRLCFPELLLNDAGAGVGDGQINTTAFPAPIAQSASWDTSLQSRFGQALGFEAWHKGINVMLAPDVNIARVPLNGRNFEAFGEDPYLSGQTGAAEITGIQQNAVIATVKHYAGNNQETNRMSVSSDIDERTLQEIYLPAFETAVKQSGVGAVMCAYNKVNGIYSCEQPTLLNRYLKQEFGFTGFVMSDWQATHSTVPAANAGLDMEMGVTPGTYFSGPLKTAVQAGQVPVSRLDDMVLRITRTMFRVGVFDHPAVNEPNGYLADVETPAEMQVARTLAEDGSVLLRNEGATLPLTDTGKTIALIGQAAGPHGTQVAYGGSGSSHIPEAGVKADVVSPLQGISQRALANGDLVTYADGTALADAMATAAAANVAVVFANDVETEGADRSDMTLRSGVCELMCLSLPASQDQLIQSVAQANPHTIVVLNTGGPVLMPWLDRVKSVVEAWYPGQEDGNAIAAILFGDLSPSGKLPQTFPRSESDLPTSTPQQYPGVNLHAVYSEGLDVGYRWYDDKGIAPLFPFGYGLSYTSFAYRNLTVTSAPSPSARATVSFDVINAGSRAGAEVAQLYVGAPADNGVHEPVKQLRGYQKVLLQPGQTARVTLPLDTRAVSYWNAASHSWTPQAGCHPVLVGSSSRDIRLQGTGVDSTLAACATVAALAQRAPAAPVAPAQSAASPLALPNTRAVAVRGPAGLAVLALGGLLPVARRRRRAALRRRLPDLD